MKEMKVKSQKAITLVALIITIIVLLILAVVAIRAVTGDGIIGHAKNARQHYEQVAAEENTLLSNLTDYITETLGNNDGKDNKDEEPVQAEVIMNKLNGRLFEFNISGYVWDYTSYDSFNENLYTYVFKEDKVIDKIEVTSDGNYNSLNQDENWELAQVYYPYGLLMEISPSLILHNQSAINGENEVLQDKVILKYVFKDGTYDTDYFNIKVSINLASED